MHFVIAGTVNCPQYAYAVMVAQRLKENLPDFTYVKMTMKPRDWERWLVKICQENEWYHIQSPIIWRELGLKNGKKSFVGDINKFLDLCYDYYGIPRDVLSAENFNKGEMNWFTARNESEFFENIKMEAKKRREYRSRQICITGASSQMTEILVMELLQMPLQARENGLEIRLFDEPTKEKKLASAANDAKYCPGPSGFGNCRVANTLKEALTNVDLVIILDSFGRKAKESLVKWLKRNRNAMCALGKALNSYAPTHCRVIIGSPSNQPICYNATVLASFATRLHVRNIVVVTMDLGREMLKALSSKIDVPLKDLYCPPVWGFVGLNKYIDVRNTLQTHLYKVPGKRYRSSLPEGSEEYELRTIECLLREEDIKDLLIRIASKKADSFPQLGRWPCLAKVTAIIDLLKLWGLKQEDGNGEILCLGVYSDGTFNIPPGLYWSQPVILSNGFWVPFAQFPIPRQTFFSYHCLFLYSLASLYRTKVKPRRYVAPNPSTKFVEKKKYDFDKVLQGVGMPAIHNDPECLKYLKQLAKDELGLDLDPATDILYEETEPDMTPLEEVVREKIYCECWRQELKELQKIVFEPTSSSTEIEVDLSDNISGSEWSLINPPSKFPDTSKKSAEKTSAKDYLTAGYKFDEEQSLSSGSVVCSCGALSTGSLCHCLDESREPKSQTERSSYEVVTVDKASTEHFYKEQNAQIYGDEDLKDAIYADLYVEGKRVNFNVEKKPCQDKQEVYLKFYGREDAIRDEERQAQEKKRIERYERFGEESFGEAEESKWSGSTDVDEKESMKGGKFQINIEGVSYDIIGDQEGLEGLDDLQKSAQYRESSKSFRDMYADEIPQTLQVLPPDAEKSTESSSEKEEFFSGEAGEVQIPLIESYKDLPSLYGERSTQEYSVTTLEAELESVYNEGLFYETWENTGEQEGEEGEGGEELPKDKYTWRSGRTKEGIPICCLCRCIIPEGLPCCPCGSSTVVEVIKKESVEVVIRTEDELSFKIEFVETLIPQEDDSQGSSVNVRRHDTLEGYAEDVVTLKERDLPPESFFPFSPKIENKFLQHQRPKELTKEYIDSLKKKPEDKIPEMCAELINKAKDKIEKEEENQEEVRKRKEGKKKEMGEKREDENLTDEGEKEGEDAGDSTECFECFCEFEDPKIFIPDGIEDWRVTVQTKYREWFFQGLNVKDESYYDIAVEEVSEDEFEVDKELEQYFEN